MDKHYTFLFRSTLIFLDLLVINNSFLLGFAYMPSGISHIIYPAFLFFLLCFNVIWFLSGMVFKLYREQTLGSLENIFRATWRSATLHAITTVVLAGLVYGEKASQFAMSLGLSYVIMIVLFILSRFFLTYIVDFLIEKGKLKNKIAIIGYNETARQLAERFQVKKSMYSFEGFFDDSYNMLKPSNGGAMIVAPLGASVSYAVEKGITEIYSTLLPDENTALQTLMREAQHNCVRIKFVPASANGMTGVYQVLHNDEYPVVGQINEPLNELKKPGKKATV